MKPWLRWPAALLPLLVWAVALVWAASPGGSVPWRAEHQLDLAATRWSGIAAQVTPLATGDGGRIEATALDANFGIYLDDVDFAATDYRYLQLDLGEVGAGLRPVLFWRVGEQNRTALMPSTGVGGTIDLSAVKGWDGRVVALGLLWQPLDVAPAAAAPERRAEVLDWRLLSVSRHSAMASVLTGWFAWEPWSGRSINTAGFDAGLPPPLPIMPWIASLLALAGFALAWLRGARLRSALLLAVCVAWLGMSLTLVRQQLWRADSYRALAAGAEQRGVATSADPALAAEVEQVVELLADAPDGMRVLVSAEGEFFRLYPAFLLRAFDVASLPSLAALPRDLERHAVVLVLVGAGDWAFDQRSRRLTLGGRELPARELHKSPRLQAYAVGTLVADR